MMRKRNKTVKGTSWEVANRPQSQGRASSTVDLVLSQRATWNHRFLTLNTMITIP